MIRVRLYFLICVCLIFGFPAEVLAQYDRTRVFVFAETGVIKLDLETPKQVFNGGLSRLEGTELPLAPQNLYPSNAAFGLGIGYHHGTSTTFSAVGQYTSSNANYLYRDGLGEFTYRSSIALWIGSVNVRQNVYGRKNIFYVNLRLSAVVVKSRFALSVDLGDAEVFIDIPSEDFDVRSDGFGVAGDLGPGFMHSKKQYSLYAQVGFRAGRADEYDGGSLTYELGGYSILLGILLPL